MNRKLLLLLICVAIVWIGWTQLSKQPDVQTTFSNATLKYGSKGDDVFELQGRLKYLGYYDGVIDGVWGSNTQNAVTWFQWKFGLKSDGIVGAQTKLKLWEATKAWTPNMTQQPETVQGDSGSSIPSSNPYNLSPNDLKIMANAVYGEARGEPFRGQVAVAAVIINRLKSESFPNTISGVIFQPGAFTAVADGQIWLEPNDSAKRAVQDAINGMDPTNGCIYYFNPVTATSKWIWTRPQVMTIGKHVFCM